MAFQYSCGNRWPWVWVHPIVAGRRSSLAPCVPQLGGDEERVLTCSWRAERVSSHKGGACVVAQRAYPWSLSLGHPSDFGCDKLRRREDLPTQILFSRPSIRSCCDIAHAFVIRVVKKHLRQFLTTRFTPLEGIRETSRRIFSKRDLAAAQDVPKTEGPVSHEPLPRADPSEITC